MPGDDVLSHDLIHLFFTILWSSYNKFPCFTEEGNWGMEAPYCFPKLTESVSRGAQVQNQAMQLPSPQSHLLVCIVPPKGSHLLSPSQGPGTVPRAVQELTCWSYNYLRKILLLQLHFKDEETEVQRGSMAWCEFQQSSPGVHILTTLTNASKFSKASRIVIS